MKTIVLATKNSGKKKEFEALLKGLNINVKSLSDFPKIPEIIEDGTTFYENALIKAKTVAEATNFIAVADDSGLVVDALNGAPGIYSARFAGDAHNDSANNQLLLKKMMDIPDENRQAAFKCVMVIFTPDGRHDYCEGQVKGIIAHHLIGENGFGYDPLFWLPEFKKTMAELTESEKNLISHRGQACRKAIPIIQQFLKETR